MRTAEQKPTIPENNLAKLPRALASLKPLPYWAGWRFKQNGNGSWQKPPVIATNPNRFASSKNPSDWCDFDTALTSLGAGAIDGISFLITEGGPVAGIDLDDCVHPATTAISPWARPFVQRAIAAKVYIELSPSGTGLRILGTTEPGSSKVHRNELVTIQGKPARVEVYRSTAKPLSITGCQFGKGVVKLRCIDGLIDWAVDFIDRHKSKAAKAGNGHDLDDVERIVQEGPPDGTDRSAVFFSVVGHYVGIGRDADWITEHIAEHPEGIGAKYIAQHRLAPEVARCVRKLQARSEGPQAEPVAAPEEKRVRVAKLKRKAPAESGPEPEEAEELPRVYSHGDAEDPDETEAWLIKDLMPIPGRGVLVGRSNIGKSFILVDLAVRLAHKTETPATFLGHKIPHPIGTLIFSAEGGPREMRKRVDTAVRESCGNRDMQLPIKWVTNFPRLRSLRADKLTRIVEKARDRMQREHGVPLGLIAFDTLSACAGLNKANEGNDASVMQDVMNRLLVLAETFTCFALCVDHPPKGDDADISGSSAKENNVDTWLGAWGKRHKNGSYSGTRLAIIKNRRGGMVGQQYPFTLRTIELGVDADGDPRTTNVVDWLPPSAISDADDPRSPLDPWVAGLKHPKQHAAMLRLKRVLFELLAAEAIEAPISEGGAMVRMVPQKVVQAAFLGRTAEDGEEQESRQGRHQAFSRARDLAEARQLIGIGQVEGKTHLWLCQPADEETQ